jgi:iron complex outermembrane receptor protein
MPVDATLPLHSIAARACDVEKTMGSTVSGERVAMAAFHTWLGATILASGMAISSAQAQTSDAPRSADDYGGDIIVTATKRTQTLQDTPVAVSVTSAAQIENMQVRDLIDLQSAVPSLRVSQLQSSANTNFIIRGFGNGANNAGIEPSVGLFIDGVYRSRSAAQIGDLPNLERVEVLRGPQSTLFGKNASAGVISIVTQKPQFDFGGSIEGTYGNFDAVTVKGTVTGPIAETVAFSISGNFNRRDGYVRDLYLGEDVNDRNRWGVRGQLLFEPSDALSIRLIGDYDKIDENCCAAGNIIAGPTVALTDLLVGGPSVDRENATSYNVYNNFLSTNLIKNYGGSAQIDYDLGQMNLTSITAYREVRADTNQDSDFSAADLIGEKSDYVDIDTFTQELRLTSDFDGPVNFLVGAYYFHEKINQQSNLFFGDDFRNYGDALIRQASSNALNVADLEVALGAFEGNAGKYVGQFFVPGRGMEEAYKLTNKSWSLFGNVDFDVTDRLRITVGGNYTQDRKRFATNVVANEAFSGIDLDAAAYAPFRQQVIQTLNPLVPADIAQALAQNPTGFTNGVSNNPLAALKAFQFVPPFLNLPNAVEPGKTKDRDFAWNVRAAYELTDTVNVYATYATGFKASSVNLSRDSRPLASDLAAINAGGLGLNNLRGGSRFAGPEQSEVYEVGLKAQWSVAALNLAVFKQSIEGFQSNVFTGTGFSLANAGKQSTVGFEFDGSVRPAEGLNLNLALTYLDAEYDSFVGSAYGDISGSRPGGIPDLSVTMGATYTHRLDSGARAVFHVDYQYETPTQVVEGFTGFGSVAQGLALARGIKREVNQLNASVTFGLANGMEIGAWGRNLTNSRYLIAGFDSVAQQGSASGYPSQPRTYGVMARYKF